MQKLTFNRGRTIFNKGDGGTDLFIISSGEVGIYFPSNSEMEKPDLILKSTEIFGEMAVIDDALRMATARAETDCILLSVNRSEFEERLSNADVVVRGVVAILSERLRDLQKRR